MFVIWIEQRVLKLYIKYKQPYNPVLYKLTTRTAFMAAVILKHSLSNWWTASYRTFYAATELHIP